MRRVHSALSTGLGASLVEFTRRVCLVFSGTGFLESVAITTGVFNDEAGWAQTPKWLKTS